MPVPPLHLYHDGVWPVSRQPNHHPSYQPPSIKPHPADVSASGAARRAGTTANKLKARPQSYLIASAHPTHLRFAPCLIQSHLFISKSQQRDHRPRTHCDQCSSPAGPPRGLQPGQRPQPAELPPLVRCVSSTRGHCTRRSGALKLRPFFAPYSLPPGCGTGRGRQWCRERVGV